VDKEALFRPRIEEDDVEIPGVGTVRVRGLTRWELLTAGQGAKETDTLIVERRMLAFGMVDPALTEAEAGQWQKCSPASEIQPVVAKINELSGVGQGANKSDLSGDGEQPGS